MHEGFVNFNAGTLGASMVEGRISAGVVVGDGSDIGGGASIMGTLSGGGKEVISIGERCLLGANAGIGISLGDDCVVEAGCYVTAGTKVTVRDGRQAAGRQGARAVGRRATCCSGRNSVTGAVEAVPWQGDGHRAQRGPARQLTDRACSRRSRPSARCVAVVAWPSRLACCRPDAASGRCLDPERLHRRRSTATPSTSTIEQAENAALIAASPISRGLPARAVVASRSRRRTRSRSCATSTTATATRSACSSSGRRQGWGTARADHGPRTTRPTPSTTRW